MYISLNMRECPFHTFRNRYIFRLTAVIDQLTNLGCVKKSWVNPSVILLTFLMRSGGVMNGRDRESSRSPTRYLNRMESQERPGKYKDTGTFADWSVKSDTRKPVIGPLHKVAFARSDWSTALAYNFATPSIEWWIQMSWHKCAGPITAPFLIMWRAVLNHLNTTSPTSRKSKTDCCEKEVYIRPWLHLQATML